MNNSFGISDTDLNYIVQTIAQFTEVKQAKIFGSRSLNNYKIGSDIDIALIGKNIPFSTVANIHALLEEESPMPYFFDIVNYETIHKIELKEHINNYGKIIYNIYS